MYLPYLLTVFLAFYLTYLRRFFVVSVWVQRGPLRSRACSWGPARTTLILGLLFGSGRDQELAVEVRQGPLWSWACCSGPAGTKSLQLSPAGTTLIRGLLFGPGRGQELAVEIRQGPLWSWACWSGPAGTKSLQLSPAGTTLIRGLLFGPGRGQELAVEVRQWTTLILSLLIWACCSGPAGTKSLQLRPGRDHSDPGFAVRAWRGQLRSRACSWGPAAEEEKEAAEEDSWYKI